MSLIALALSLALAAPTDTTRSTVILVRHAEKASDTERDPHLSEAGKLRAMALDSALADAHVVAIVVSQYQRTSETAALVAARHHLTPIVVPVEASVDAHVAAVVKVARAMDGVVLVVGHNNTVPRIVHALGGPALADLCEKSFAQFFTVVPGASGAQLVRSTYGAADPATAVCGAMK